MESTTDLGGDRRIVRHATVALGTIVAVLATSICLVVAEGASVWVGVLLTAGLGVATALIVRLALAGPLLDRAAAHAAEHHEAASRLRRLDEINRTLDQAQVALDQAGDEDEAVAVVARGIATLFPGLAANVPRPGDAGPPGARRRWFGPNGAGASEAIEDGRCRAVAIGRRTLHRSTTDLDACPHLGDLEGERSSVCTPVTIGGRPWGSLHLLGPVDHVPGDDLLAALDHLTRAFAGRLAGLRLEVAERIGGQDPLTGLIDRAGFDAELQRLLMSSSTTSVALCDIDDYTGYVHTYGADAGDRALRAVAEAIVSSLRPGDLAARVDNDAFGLVLGGCTAEQATAATERIRERLVLDLAEEGLAPFGWSAGIADSSEAASDTAIFEAAELALIVAKREGGGRVRTASSVEAPDGPSAD